MSIGYEANVECRNASIKHISIPQRSSNYVWLAVPHLKVFGEWYVLSMNSSLQVNLTKLLSKYNSLISYDCWHHTVFQWLLYINSPNIYHTHQSILRLFRMNRYVCRYVLTILQMFLHYSMFLLCQQWTTSGRPRRSYSWHGLTLIPKMGKWLQSV